MDVESYHLINHLIHPKVFACIYSEPKIINVPQN